MTIYESSTVLTPLLDGHSYYSMKRKELKLLSVSHSKCLEDKKHLL